MRELGIWARLFRFDGILPQTICAEAVTHANGLKTQSPSRRVCKQIPVLNWDKRVRLISQSVLKFEQGGLDFLWQSISRCKMTLSAWAVFRCFVGMDRENRSLRTNLPENSKIITEGLKTFISIQRDSCSVSKKHLMRALMCPVRTYTKIVVFQYMPNSPRSPLAGKNVLDIFVEVRSPCMV